ncbi:NAD(P)/FAD-dependent oxidoreductase [Ruminiclostridium cellulolyticum]|uniref:NADH:ubiquinone reductase (non-electrogenic) n=1 Tax=Ruminiclostridium cellulolyticum (strain ATCC 35319 / DSM 5812 / JCM 6584 / H10) TaxID=394503 RepID=B8HZX0_RUMCH|nr:NAD(P)/FAD-dependent oxidoreductase [Ruminiclostridium cellulolyticum]ACL75470.1 FAD-dependent pyridine nucleotide-disulphide oxidoreductase [Ruminiclostridium cellulolyticum H10]
MKSKILIIGAGYAGILTAKKLAKKFKKNYDVNITIIDKNPFHTMLTELHEVAANRVDEDSIKISLSKVFAGRKVNVVLDTVESIDFENNTVAGNSGTYDYEYLVLAAGSKPTYFGVPGAEEFSHKLWSFEDAVNLREHIHNCFRKAATETNLEEKKRLLTFHVVGAGFTGVEMVGELAEYVPILCEKYEIDRKYVSVYNVDVLTRTVPNLPEKLSNKVENRLKKMGVVMMLNNGVVGVGADFIETKNGDKVTRHTAGTVIWAAGIESSDITNKAANTLQSAARGRIKLDKYLRSIDNDHVYVVGDNMLYIPEGEERPVPQMVENCEQSAAVAAKNICSAITGKGEMTVYKPSFHGMMVCIGGRYGVARVGLPKFMFNLPSFLAMFAKHFINIIYFIQVLGWNKIFSYIKHEFFTIRNCRSFVGGHFSNRTPSFLLVALRVWLGAVWLFEGIMKIVGGWFNKPQLKGFFGGANGWYDSILKGATDGTSSAPAKAGAAVAEAVSSATTAGGGEAVAEGINQIGTTIINFDFLNLFRVIFVSGKQIAESTLSDFAFRLDIPLMNTFVNKVILANDSIQMFMQISIVIAEILIGLALIGGLFTTPASAVSLILQFMFVCTTGLYLGTFWMIFAGIAVLIGAGRTFGLDYYVMPFLKRQWKKIPIVRKWYIYND